MIVYFIYQVIKLIHNISLTYIDISDSTTCMHSMHCIHMYLKKLIYIYITSTHLK